MGYIGKKIAGFQDIVVEILATLIGGVRHMMFLSINIGSITTDIVSYSILATDVLINLLNCFAILWCNCHDTKKNRERQVTYMMSLIVNEAVEILMPIAYVICLSMAYFGPNAEILGGIKNSNWQYSAIEDFNNTIKWMVILFSVDIASLLVSVIVLGWYCKLNVLKMYLQLQDEIWYIMAIVQAYMLSEVVLCLYYILQK